MSYDLELEIDLEGTIEEFESGGKLEIPGWYLATCVDVDRKKEEAFNLVFEVKEGPHKGSRVWEFLVIPTYEEPEKLKKTQAKFGMVAQRLGLWDGQSRPFKANFFEAIGRTYVIHVTNQSWKGEGGESKSKVGLAYAGIYPVDHPKIPDEIRKALRLPPARAKDAGPTLFAATKSESELKAAVQKRLQEEDLSDL